MRRVHDLTRRRLLGLVGLESLSTIAGCNAINDSTPASSDTPEPTETVIFTDSASSTPTLSPQPQFGTPTQINSKTDSPTSTPGAIVFDGGDIDAFMAALDTLKNRGGGVLSIEPGVYRFDTYSGADLRGREPHARIKNLENVTIEGNGATIIFTVPTLPGFRFRGGGGITIKDLTFDYDPPPYTQGTVTDLSDDKLTIGISLEDDFPRLSHDMFGIVDEVYALTFTADGEFVRGYPKEGGWDLYVESISERDDGTFELQVSDSSTTTGLTEGMRLVVLARNNRTTVSFYKVSGPTLQNVTIRAANGAAHSTSVCEAPTFRDCVIEPSAESERLLSANADGIRVINCIESVLVEGCRHEYLGDDSLVIQNTMSSVTNVWTNRTVEVENVHPFMVRQGDVLHGLSPNGVDKGQLPPIFDFVSRFPTDEEWKKPARITFEEPIDDRLTEGDFLRNPASGSQNFTVRNNEFRNHRANLIRIAASHGEVTNNVLEGCPINPIELETDTYGFFAPKGWVRDVVVSDNRIERPGLNYYAGQNPVGIHVHLRVAPEATPNGRPNRDIRISNNTITHGASGGVHIASAENVRVADNEMANLNRLDIPGFADFGVSLDNVVSADVVDNVAIGSDDSLDYFGMKSEAESVTEDGNQLIIGGETRPGKLIELVPMLFEFNQTVRPSEVNDDSDDDRPLAFRCQWLQLLNEDDEVIVDIDVGTAEEGISFGEGVFPPEDDDWRWFGGPSKKARLSFAESELEQATRLRFHGYPMASGISAVIYVESHRTDEVSFGRREPQTFDVSLTTS